MKKNESLQAENAARRCAPPVFSVYLLADLLDNNSSCTSVGRVII